MDALTSKFGFTAAAYGKSLSLFEGDHIRIYPVERHRLFGEQLNARQMDLIRIATAVHVADGWVNRKSTFNGLRNPIVQVEVLDRAFWSRPDTMGLLKKCVDFLSGGDDWEFSFVASKGTRHVPCSNLFSEQDENALVCLYSGGLDSSSGLALRAAAQPGRMIVPVTIRHQMQKSQLVRRHFKLLMDAGLLKRADFNPFQAGVFIRNQRIKREFSERFREITHRCRPLLFMSVAGLVASSFNASEVEVFESGVGSVNLPLVGGPADYRTTRSTHPHFLRLISALVSHVNGAAVAYVLPFADKTKAEMAALLKEIGLEELARISVSCILHPLKRNGWQQCGWCPACVFRRQAMLSADISEDKGAYHTDLFIEAESGHRIPPKAMDWVMAFHEQVARLHELDSGNIPFSFRRYLRATKAASTEEQIRMHAEVYRRYRREWLLLIADARRRNFPWVIPARSRAALDGANA